MVRVFTPLHRGGSGSPLLLLHGFTGTWRAWDLVLPALERRHDVLAPTLAGHAGGPALNGNLSDSVLADHVEQAMDQAGFETAHIAGNSLGGRIALEAAADGLVGSATTLSPAAFWWGAPDFVYVRTVFTWLTTSANLMAPIVPRLARSPRARRVMGAMV